MRCPYCGETNNKVIDSRLSKVGNVIRRRRECIDCTRRFTTYEHIEEIPVFEFSTEKKFSLRYYNSATGESYDQDVSFPNDAFTSVAIDVNAKLENKRRRMERGHEFYRKLLALRNTDTISKKESEKLIYMWDEGKNFSSENTQLALKIVRQQFSNLKIGN